MRVKAPNAAPGRSTVRFSLAESQLEQLREFAMAREVGVSRMAREALEVAFQHWEQEGALATCVPAARDGERVDWRGAGLDGAPPKD